MKILAVSGSLRPESSSTAILRAAAAISPPSLVVTLYAGLGDLPHYTPDLDGDDPPASVSEWRRLLRAADGVLICTPEYAHGMPGSLKNALDWVVSSGEFDGGKPTAAISASPSILGGDKALAWLVQTLSVVGATIPEGASFPIPFVRKKFDAHGALSDPATREALRSALHALAREIEARG